MKYLDAIGREIPDEALEDFFNAEDGAFEVDEKKTKLSLSQMDIMCCLAVYQSQLDANSRKER